MTIFIFIHLDIESESEYEYKTWTTYLFSTIYLQVSTIML